MLNLRIGNLSPNSLAGSQKDLLSISNPIAMRSFWNSRMRWAEQLQYETAIEGISRENFLDPSTGGFEKFEDLVVEKLYLRS